MYSQLWSLQPCLWQTTGCEKKSSINMNLQFINKKIAYDKHDNFQRLLVTHVITPNCGNNLVPKHWQPTEADKKGW